MTRLKQLIRENWLWIPVGIYALVWGSIMLQTANDRCEGIGLVNARGPCLVRSIAELSCFAVYLGVWTWLGGEVAVRKNRRRLLGNILGFTLQFMGCLFMMTWEIKYTCPRCGKRVQSQGLCTDCFLGRTPG